MRNLNSPIKDYNDQFRGFKQNDSGKLLNTVLNMIHEETNSVESPIKMKIMEEGEMDESLFEKYVRRDKDRAHSIIDDIFTGRFKTAEIQKAL
jgi:ubiquitin C-terminal hydrolase